MVKFLSEEFRRYTGIASEKQPEQTEEGENEFNLSEYHNPEKEHWLHNLMILKMINQKQIINVDTTDVETTKHKIE